MAPFLRALWISILGRRQSSCLSDPSHSVMQGRILRARLDLLPGGNREEHTHSEAPLKKPKVSLLQVTTLFCLRVQKSLIFPVVEIMESSRCSFVEHSPVLNVQITWEFTSTLSVRTFFLLSSLLMPNADTHCSNCYTGICKLCGKDLELSPETCFHETISFCLIIHTFLSFIISIFFYFPKGPEEGASLCTHTVLMPTSAVVQTQS